MERFLRRIIWTVFLLPSLFGCYKREPILSEVSRYAVRFEEEGDDTSLERLQFTLYDAETEREVYRTFMGKEGGYLYSVRPGTYKVAVWSMNSACTSITYSDRYDLLTAESRIVQETPTRVMVSPDGVYAYSCEEFTVPYLTEEDEPAVFTFRLEDVVDIWNIEVDGLRGLENYVGSSFFISNQVQELYFKDWKPNGTAVVKASGEVMESLVVCRFGTFGMEQDAAVTVLVRILARDGFVHEKTVDVTPQIKDPGNSAHVIRIPFEAELHPLEQGGLLPSADEWDENTQIIDLM